ncbi:MAG TPA: HEAT repeat domain-containing protein [Planctomycetota bacterium]|jgi:hypothetical protein
MPDASQPSSPPNPPEKGELRFFGAPEKEKSWASKLLLFVVVGGAIGVVLMLFAGIKTLPGRQPSVQKTTPAVQPATEVKPKAAEAKPSQASSLFSAAKLRGNGITLAQFAEELERALGAKIEWQPTELSAFAPHLHVSGYEGDELLSPDDAASMLIYAGLQFERAKDSTGGRIRFRNSIERAWEILSADADPDGRNWGALRPWQALTIKDDRSFAEVLEAAKKPSAASSGALEWAIAGSARSFTIDDGGRVASTYETKATDEQLQAAEKLLAALNADIKPLARAQIALTLGEILGRAPQAQFSAERPALEALRKLLEDADADVARSAALALGRSAAVAGLELLAGRLESWRQKADRLPAAMLSVWQVESLGRRIPYDELGAAAFDRRRVLLDKVKEFLQATAREQTDLEFIAAWLRLADVFRPGDEAAKMREPFIAKLRESKALGPQWVAKSMEFGNEPVYPTGDALGDALKMGSVAGPQWHKSKFTFAQAQEMLATNQRRMIQATLWRLTRPTPPKEAVDPSDASARALAAQIEGLARQSVSPILRRLALEALYRERPRAGGERWRLALTFDLAVELFMNDADPAVQVKVADILARQAGAPEVVRCTQVDFASRTPQAVIDLLTGMVRRGWSNAQTADVEFFTSALEGLIERMLALGQGPLATKAAWAKMYDPLLDHAMRIRLTRSFPNVAQRVAAMQALGELRQRSGWQPKMISILLGDKAAEVRAAVFSAQLPTVVQPKEERAKVYEAGLADPEAAVRLAVLQAPGDGLTQLKAELRAKIKALAEQDPAAEVRAAAEKISKQ